MIDVCPAVPAGAGFISSMTGYVDCQAQILGSGAWEALAAPGSTLTVVLTAFLTIFIALIGYNLLLGHSMTVRSGTLAFVKIGAVFALATSWPAYRTLVYDLVTGGPAQLVAEIGPRAGVVGADGTVTQRLDDVDATMAQLAVLGTGPLPAQLTDSSGAYVPPPPFAGFNAFGLGGSRILFELTAVAGLGIVRIISGLMLALGPFFIAFLMFDNTRSLFEGWVRVLAGTALGGVGVSVVLGLELALIEPWLTEVLARRMAGEALPSIATELFVITCLFSILVFAALYACARVTRAFRLAPLLRAQSVVVEQSGRGAAAIQMDNLAPRNIVSSEASRAAAIANILVATSQREHGATATMLRAVSASSGRFAAASRNGAMYASPPVGRTFTRRPHSRVSAVATRRDSGA